MRTTATSFLILVLALAGCNMKLRDGQVAYREGDIQGACAKISKYADKSKENHNTVIAYLEKGNVLRNLGRYEESNHAFAIADQKLDQLDQEADLSITRQGMSAISNPNALTYRGTNYDRIMVSTYRALNFLALGDVESARVELRKTYQRQAEAVERNAKRIEKAQEACAEEAGYDAQKAQDDPGFKGSVDQQFGELDKFAAYADYTNPFSEWLQGIYYVSAAADADDLERARVAMKRAAGMASVNAFLKADCEMAEKAVAGTPLPPITYVVFETGVAPSRGQIRIDVPLRLVVGRGPPYIGANFPRLKYHDGYVPSLQVSGGGQTCDTQTLCDMDAVVSREFKNELPVIILQTLISTGTKAAAAYAIDEATRDDPTANIVALIATTAYQAVTNEADLRTWASLPKQFQYARLDTPQDRKIALTGAGQPPITLDLIDGQVNFVFVRSVVPGMPLQITQFKIK